MNDPSLAWPTVTQVMEFTRSGYDYATTNRQGGADYIPYRFLSIPEAALSQATDRGVHVHMCCSDAAKGLYPYWKENQQVLPYMEQWMEFWDTCGCQLIATEERCNNSLHQYRGRLDFRLTMYAGQANKEHEAVIDLKTAKDRNNPFDAIQTQAYKSCFVQELRRYALYLSDNNWRLIEHRRTADYSAWLSMLNVYKWAQLVKERGVSND